MKKATELMMDPTTHALWCYGDDMMGRLLTHLDSSVLIQLSGLVRKVFGDKLARMAALDWAWDSDDYNMDTESPDWGNLQGQVDLINELVWMSVPSFPGIPKVWDTVRLKAEPMQREIEDARRKRAKFRRGDGEELYYCYSLRSEEPYPKDACGELVYGVRLDDDGHLRTHCYGREQLKWELRPGWKVTEVRLAHSCKPHAPLP